MKPADIETVRIAAEKAIYKAIGFSRHSRTQRAVVEDLIQETYVKILINFDPDRGLIGGLAYTAASHLAIEYVRGRASAGGTHKGTASMTVTDESGADTVMDIASHTPSALSQMIAAERDRNVANAIETYLPESGKRAILAMMADEDINVEVADRVAKHRAIDTLQEHVLSPGYVARTVAKRVKAKREPKIEAEIVEAAPQRGLSTLTKWSYQVAMMGTPVGISQLRANITADVDVGWSMVG